VDTNAYIGECVSGIVYLFVGARLYGLSRRTGEAPERLIAASFLLWALAYAVWDVPYAFVDAEAGLPAPYAFASQVALTLGNVVFAFFICTVFRPTARWALGLALAIAASNVAGLAGMAWHGDWEGVSALGGSGYWLEYFGSLAPTLWMGAEGFGQYFKLRKQLALGLCEPMACNRFLLWGLAGLLWATLEALVAATDIVHAQTGEWSGLLGIGTGLFEFVPIAIVWLVFFPPAFYRRWVERVAA